MNKTLQPLPILADDALSAAVDAGVVAELAASVASGAYFDAIVLMAFQDFICRQVSVRGRQTGMCQQSGAENGYQSHEGDTGCVHDESS